MIMTLATGLSLLIFSGVVNSSVSYILFRKSAIYPSKNNSQII